MDTYETTAKYNIAETCCASISVEDLCALDEDKRSSPFSLSTKLGYGAIRGSVCQSFPESLPVFLAYIYSLFVKSDDLGISLQSRRDQQLLTLVPTGETPL